MTLHGTAFLALGMTAFAVGTIGIFLPLLPTVPFYILAAYAFARSNPAWEARLLDHPHFGPHIKAWREQGAISRRGKYAAIAMMTASAIGGLFLLPMPWALAPAAIVLATGTWLATRPDA